MGGGGYRDQAVVLHTPYSQHLEGRGKWISEASLIYRASSGTVKVIQRNAVSRKQIIININIEPSLNSKTG